MYFTVIFIVYMKMVLLVRLISELTHFNNEELRNVHIEVLANENIITFSEKNKKGLDAISSNCAVCRSDIR